MSDEETKTICGTCGTPIFIVEETEEDGIVWAHEQVIRCDDPDPRPVHSVVEVSPVDPRRRNPGVRNPGLLLAAMLGMANLGGSVFYAPLPSEPVYPSRRKPGVGPADEARQEAAERKRQRRAAKARQDAERSARGRGEGV